MKVCKIGKRVFSSGLPTVPEREPFPDDDPVPQEPPTPKTPIPDEPETDPRQPNPDTSQPVIADISSHEL